MTSSVPNEYRPLATALPSHPGFATRKSSRAVDTTDHDIDAPAASAGSALSAISSLLLGGQTSNRAHTQSQATGNPSSLLTRRRGKDSANNFSLGNAFDLTFLRARSTKNDERRESIAQLPSEHLQVRRKKTPMHRDEAAEDLPPSPVGLPGAWFDQLSDSHGALLLPPPFLDGHSTPQSFEGVLGTRFARETSARARREARNYARDRPPPPTFPASLLATASKLVNALGPPGGVDSGPMYRRWKDDPNDMTPGTIKKERRQVERAEKGLRGYEFGEKIAQRIAERFRREGIDPAEMSKALAGGNSSVAHRVVHATREVLAAATPMSLLGQPPTPISPPLLAFPTPSLQETELNSLTYPPPDVKVLKPTLRPVDFEGEPSPLPLQPEEPPPKNISESSDYFGIRKRRKSLQRTASTSQVMPDQDPIQTRNRESGVAIPRDSPEDAVKAPTKHVIEQNRRYSDLFLFILVGRPVPNVGLDRGFSSIGGLLGMLLHLIGFAAFVAVHSWALVVSFVLTSRSISYFLHWTYLNLSGQTDLSIVLKDYFKLCRHEWDIVYAEDGQRLSAWSIALGLLELMAIQAMSKERWLAEGPGHLELLAGKADPFSSSLSTSRDQTFEAKSPRLPRRRSLRRRPSARTSAGDWQSWYLDKAPGESLLVTGGGDSIMEGRILSNPFDQLAFSPSFSPRPPRVSDPADSGEDDDGDLPPLDLNETLPGFSLTRSPKSLRMSPVSPPLRPLADDEDSDSAFVALLQRHVRLATASYGLHSYILAPPSPLFTPGVNHQTLPHRVFTHLGGVDHKTSSVLHVAIQKHYTGVPAKSVDVEESYEPQFYLLRDDLRGEVVCVVRGTQSLADIRTDLEAGLEEVELPSLEPGGGTEIFLAHAGILGAAQRLLQSETSPLFAKLKSALEETGYSLVFNGHSLGAAIASTLAFLVGQYTPPPTRKGRNSDTVDEGGTWSTSETCGLPPGRPVRAICFAHPASVGIPLARRCSIGAIPLVISISYGPDAVTRMGVPQVRELRRALGRLANNRRKWVSRNKEKRVSGHGKSEILSAWWRWKSLGSETTVQDLAEHTDEQRQERRLLEDKAWRWRKEVDGEASETSKTSAIPAGRCYHVDRLPSDLERERRKEIEDEVAARLDAGADDDDEDEAPIVGIYNVRRPAAFYAIPLLEADLVKKHLPKEYLDAINAL